MPLADLSSGSPSPRFFALSQAHSNAFCQRGTPPPTNSLKYGSLKMASFLLRASFSASWMWALPPRPLSTSRRRSSNSCGLNGVWSCPTRDTVLETAPTAPLVRAEDSRAVRLATDLSSDSEVGRPSLRFTYAFVASLACRFATTELATMQTFSQSRFFLLQLIAVRSAKRFFHSDGYRFMISAPTPPSARRTTE